MKQRMILGIQTRCNDAQIIFKTAMSTIDEAEQNNFHFNKLCSKAEDVLVMHLSLRCSKAEARGFLTFWTVLLVSLKSLLSIVLLETLEGAQQGSVGAHVPLAP